MSAAGQGSISFSGKQAQGGAPFPAGAAYNGCSVDPITGQIVLGNDSGDPAVPGSITTQREVQFSNGAGVRWGAPSGTGFGGQGSFEIGLLYGPPGGSFTFLVEGTRADGLTDHNLFVFTKSGLSITDEVGGVRNCLEVSTNSVGSVISTELEFQTAQTLQTGQPSANGAGKWLLGKNVVAASVLDATQYIEIMIDGVLVKLARIV